MQNKELKSAVAELSRQASLFCTATETLSLCISQFEPHSHEESLSDLVSMTRELTEVTRIFTGDAIRIEKMLRDKMSV